MGGGHSPFPFINCHLPMGHICLSPLYPLSIQSQSLSLQGKYPSLPSRVPFPFSLTHPLSPVFVFCFLPSVPLGQINLLCAENTDWGVLWWLRSFRDTSAVIHLIVCPTPWPHDKHHHSCLLLFFYLVSRDQTHTSMLARKALYRLRYLPGLLTSRSL